jgi:hypothetical protein|tara:strand:- start:308 stop:1504 length:1197 start_codon:yes stop_codon:yes gene_type:complete
MKKLLYILCVLFCFNLNAQILKKFYDEVFKYSTVYIAGDMSNAYENTRKDYFVERPDANDLYAIPKVIDVTEYYPFDYRAGIGVRRMARFDYEIKQNYIDGTENMIGLSAPTAAVKGFEYLFHWEKERERGEEFINTRYFLRHTGKYHIVKLEQREQGNVGFKYQSGELRFRIPIGFKFSFSLGAMYRTHQTAYGYNPIEIWLNETAIWVNPDTGQEIEYPKNAWYSLGYVYGYTDHLTRYTDVQTNEQRTDWIWKDSNGKIVAYSDIDFRNGVFGDLMNRYNNEIWDELDGFGVVSPVVGFDFYHSRNNFWTHIYGSYLPPYHEYVSGDIDVSYLNRNNWGKGGLRKDSELEQWEDYQFGAIIGLKLKRFGIFIEGEYTKFWDTKIYNSSIGINYML